MKWYSGLESIMTRDVALADYTTLRIGGKAAFMLTPTDQDTFAAAYNAARTAGLAVHILGLGSNLLVADEGVPGVVLCTCGLRRRKLTPSGDTVQVGAGVRLRELVSWVGGKGLRGMEFLAGVPGTIGGAVIMNAGSLENCLGDCVAAIWCVDEQGNIVRRSGRDILWEYRGSDIRQPVVQVELQLQRDNADAVLERMAEALIAKRQMQPAGIPSAGCFFKNPPGEFAGRLIDAVGLKGESFGNAAVSAKHANFIVNQGGARAAHVLELCNIIRERVRSKFGISLDTEVCFWPSVPGNA